MRTLYTAVAATLISCAHDPNFARTNSGRIPCIEQSPPQQPVPKVLFPRFTEVKGGILPIAIYANSDLYTVGEIVGDYIRVTAKPLEEEIFLDYDCNGSDRGDGIQQKVELPNPYGEGTIICTLWGYIGRNNRQASYSQVNGYSPCDQFRVERVRRHH